MDTSRALGLIAATIAADWLLARSVGWWRRTEDDRRRLEAERVLRSHGMEAYTYLASFGAEAGSVRDALSMFDLTGQVVLDQEGRLVGRVLPKVAPGAKGLRLVVDNTK